MNIVPQLVANSIIAGSIYALVAMSFNLAYGATKFFNLAHGAMAVIGGYTAFFLLKSLALNIPVIVIVIVSILAAGIAGFLLEKIIYLPLRRRRASTMVLLVASLGAFTAIEAVVAMLFTNQFRALGYGGNIQKIYQFFGAIFTQTQLFMAASSIVVAVGLFLILKYTVFGKAVCAISDDEEMARIVGINTNKIIGTVFLTASGIAGLAGVLIGFDTGIEPTMGLTLLLKGVIAAIVGGVGTVSGGFLGAFLLGFVENFGIWKISGEWKDAIAFLLLIIFLLIRPRGIIQR